MLGNFLDYSSALGGDEKMELGSFTIYGTSNSGLSGPAGYTSDVLQLRDPSDNLLLQFGFKGEIIGIDSSSSMGFMIVRDTGAPDIRMTMGTLTDYLNLVGKSANTGPRIDIGPATTNGRLNIFAALAHVRGV